MTPTNDNPDVRRLPGEVEEEAAKAFLRRQDGGWTVLDQVDLEAWLADPDRADAYQKVSDTWQAVGNHATSPELIAFRQQALGSIRGAGSKRGFNENLVSRWKWAAAAVVVVAIGLIPALYDDDVRETAYETGIGEQRVVELEDRSRIALDALTTLHVRMTRDSRVIELNQGQAHFMVASDPRRPFRVEAGDHTITAVGTSFNVQYLDRKMQVAMVEGKVAVSVEAPSGSLANEPGSPGPFAVPRKAIELVAGQALHVGPDGQPVLVQNADIAAAIAWRQGILVLTDMLLSDAVQELNRHSQLQIRISDPAVGTLRVNGVFEPGNTQAFLEAVQSFLPVRVYQDSPDLVTLSPGPEPGHQQLN